MAINARGGEQDSAADDVFTIGTVLALFNSEKNITKIEYKRWDFFFQ